MDVEATLTLLRKHEVKEAAFDAEGRLLAVKFGTTAPPDESGGEDDDDPFEPFVSKMHSAAGVLQGRQRSMRDEGNNVD